MSTAKGSLLDVLVVGAGLSGLVLAWRLCSAGREVLLCEAGEQPGGAMTSCRINDFLCEGGLSSFSETPELLQLIGELAIESELVYSAPRPGRFVWWDGRLRPVPLSVGQLLSSDLLSWGGKGQLLCELFVPTLSESREETVGEFIYRRFGEETLTRLVEPVLSGLWAGDVGQLSVEAVLPRLVAFERESGSVLGGQWQARRRGVVALPRTCSFREGVQVLPDALAAQLHRQLRCNQKLIALERTLGGWRAVFTGDAGELIVEAHSIVLATPAYAVAGILSTFDPELGRALDSIYYPPLAVVNLGYPASQIPQAPEGIGHLVPRSQGLRTLDALWSSGLFPDRAPAGWRQYTCFIGGTTDLSAQGLSDTELASLAHRELQVVLGFQSGHQLLRLTRWPQSIPQYTLGHLAKQARVEERLTRWPGLFLAGNYFDGISVGDCVHNAFTRGERVQAFLQNTSGTSLQSA